MSERMSRREIEHRQLEIGVELGELSRREIEVRRDMLNLEECAARLNHELAKLALLESELPPALQPRVKHAG